MSWFIQKQYPENFALLIVRIPELFTRVKFVFFVKSNLLFSIFYCLLLYVCKQTFDISQVSISRKNGAIMQYLRDITFM